MAVDPVRNVAAAAKLRHEIQSLEHERNVSRKTFDKKMELMRKRSQKFDDIRREIHIKTCLSAIKSDSVDEKTYNTTYDNMTNRQAGILTMAPIWTMSPRNKLDALVLNNASEKDTNIEANSDGIFQSTAVPNMFTGVSKGQSDRLTSRRSSEEPYPNPKQKKGVSKLSRSFTTVAHSPESKFEISDIISGKGVENHGNPQLKPKIIVDLRQTIKTTLPPLFNVPITKEEIENEKYREFRVKKKLEEAERMASIETKRKMFIADVIKFTRVPSKSKWRPFRAAVNAMKLFRKPQPKRIDKKPHPVFYF